jgi:undecaprenyl-diphosphatase
LKLALEDLALQWFKCVLKVSHMSIFDTIIIAIIEGLTEFLPISSTGHMIIASSFMGIAKDDFTKLFEIAIQLGAIMSVVVIYWKKFFPLNRWNFYIKLIVAVIPALVLGFIFSNKIDALLESPLTVSITLLLGGIVLLFIDKLFKAPTVEREEQISLSKAFMIGVWQCLAMIPGTSRSAASIIGGMQQNLNRKLAAEFSFFLAVPTMAAATGYKLLKAYKENPELLTNKDNLIALGIGNLVAFVVAIIAIKFFIGFLQKHGFRLFGWYRIIAGIILLVLIYTGQLK